MEDGSLLAAGLRAHQASRQADREDDVPKITAFRLELLNDPNLPLGGPGRSIKGTGALTEFEVEAAPATSRQAGKGQDREGHGRYQPAGDAARSDLRRQDRQAPRHRPVEFAIDGKDETAWGIDAGPGLRNQPRKAVFTAAEADR